MDRATKMTRAQENAHYKKEIEKCLAEIDRGWAEIRALREAAERSQGHREAMMAETRRIVEGLSCSSNSSTTFTA